MSLRDTKSAVSSLLKNLSKFPILMACTSWLIQAAHIFGISNIVSMLIESCSGLGA